LRRKTQHNSQQISKHKCFAIKNEIKLSFFSFSQGFDLLTAFYRLFLTQFLSLLLCDLLTENDKIKSVTLVAKQRTMMAFGVNFMVGFFMIQTEM
jgi:hypothetical protein